MHITTNPLKMIMSAYHTIKRLGHNIVLKEIQHLTGMTHCASLSGMAQFGSESRGGYVHVYKIIKQLFHACSGNSQNYCPSVLEMTWELLPSALGLRQQFSSHLQHLVSIVLTVP
jgi:hypothetical protein